MSEPTAEVPPEKRRRKHQGISYLWYTLGLIVLFVVITAMHSAKLEQGVPTGRLNARMHSKEIAVGLYVYARNHGGTYPEGGSSTEIFQKLLDEGYVDDPIIFYVAMPGKIAPERKQKTLKPENISFDVTVPVDARTSDRLPLVFLTGYKVTYEPGAAAVPVIKPHPTYGESTWFSHPDIDGMAVSYNNDKSQYIPWAADFTIPNFVPPEFKADGMTYRQLTPDGPVQ